MYRRIRDLREDRDLRQKDLAEVLPLHPGMLFPL